MTKEIIENTKDGTSRYVNKIDLAETFSKRLNITSQDLESILAELQEEIILSLFAVKKCKSQDGKLEDNFIELPKICAFTMKEVEDKDNKRKYYAISTCISEKIINAIQ